MYRRRRPIRYAPSRNRSSGCLRLGLALIIGIIALVSFMGSKEYNPVTGEEQYVSLTPEQEIALGLNTAPEMIRQLGGLYPDQEVQSFVDELGQGIVSNSTAGLTDWAFDFHVLDEPDMVNAMALPGGQIFITTGLLGRIETEGQLAGVLAHEIVHVLARHGSQQLAKQQLTQGLIGAVSVASIDPENPSSQQVAALAAMAGQLINMSFGRDDELQSDELGVRFMAEAGYDPRSMLAVMQILAQATRGNTPPEFFSTHPNPENRLQNIEDSIRAVFPEGVPPGLIP